jgi:hypothetical protein
MGGDITCGGDMRGSDCCNHHTEEKQGEENESNQCKRLQK